MKVPKSRQSDPNAVPIMFLGLIALFLGGSLLNSDQFVASYFQQRSSYFLLSSMFAYCLMSFKFLLVGAGLCSFGYGLIAALSGTRVKFGQLIKSLLAAFAALQL